MSHEIPRQLKRLVDEVAMILATSPDCPKREDGSFDDEALARVVMRHLSDRYPAHWHLLAKAAVPFVVAERVRYVTRNRVLACELGPLDGRPVVEARQWMAIRLPGEKRFRRKDRRTDGLVADLDAELAYYEGQIASMERRRAAVLAQQRAAAAAGLGPDDKIGAVLRHVGDVR